jgi:hypothetical protein
MFDLNTLALKDTVELQLRHPVSDEALFADEAGKLPVSIVLFGTSSKQYRNAVTAMQNRQIKRGNKKPVSAEVMRDEGIALLVSCSSKALNFEYNGAPVDSDEAFRSLYGDASFGWIKDQVDAALGDASLFIKE